ncbi:hypothetical protein [Pelosinus sp. IPA-1]|uniref:hypothetical protein n=1 Tax=Pelosinus sp. IPA-1 TaxID=3029569 RepID=UPI0024361604|nr:hypothetical protein [Pelosinus sp. IPA-1]GMB01859.1 hypothetical protein PIPA1_46590 [Pelosinus sp. IPA-1]
MTPFNKMRAGMRSVSLKKKGLKYIISVDADGHSRQYVEDDLEVAKTRVEKIKLMLSIK